MPNQVPFRSSRLGCRPRSQARLFRYGAPDQQAPRLRWREITLILGAVLPAANDGPGGSRSRSSKVNLTLVWVLVVGLSNGGCGLLFQSIAGWREEVVTTEQRYRRVQIETDPPGAQVIRLDADRIPTAIGSAPLEASYSEEVEIESQEPRIGWMVVGLAVDVALSASWGAFCLLEQERYCRNELRAGTPVMLMSLLGDGIFALLAYRRRPNISERPNAAPTVAFYAQGDGLRSVMVAPMGGVDRLDLRLTETYAPSRSAAGPALQLELHHRMAPTVQVGLLLTAIEGGVASALRTLGRRLTTGPAEPGQEALHLELEEADGRCRLRVWLAGADKGAAEPKEAVTQGRCDPDLQAAEARAVVLRLLSGPSP